jgi:hypothetical protein
MGSSASDTQNGRSFDKIMEDFRQSSLSFQQPADLIILLGYSVNLFAAIRICNESGAFRILAASSGPVPVSEIAKKLEGAPQDDTEDNHAEREEYITRMLRAVCALNLVDEAGPHVFQANDLTRTLAEDGFHLGFKELYDAALGPHSTIAHMNYMGKKSAWKAPVRAPDGPYQAARGIVGQNTFEHWVKDDPTMLSNLSALMKIIQRDRLNWSAWFPADVLFPSSETGKSDEVFMVDVGGGLGHDLMGLASRYPDKKIRLIVEDLPSVIAETREEKLDPRIELVEHDFFTKQPVKGAKIVSDLLQATQFLPVWTDQDTLFVVFHAQDHARLARR